MGQDLRPKTPAPSCLCEALGFRGTSAWLAARSVRCHFGFSEELEEATIWGIPAQVGQWCVNNVGSHGRIRAHTRTQQARTLHPFRLILQALNQQRRGLCALIEQVPESRRAC